MYICVFVSLKKHTTLIEEHDEALERHATEYGDELEMYREEISRMKEQNVRTLGASASERDKLLRQARDLQTTLENEVFTRNRASHN